MKPSKEKRIAIAKDVIKQVRYLKISPSYYINMIPICHYIDRLEEKGKSYDSNAQKHLKELRKCEVCALGSMLLSHIKLFNSVEITDIFSDFECMDNHLNYFTEKQLILIELAFMGVMVRFGPTSLSEKEFNHCLRWRHLIIDEKQRVIAIMKNIIKNDGEFIPSQLPIRKNKHGA